MRESYGGRGGRAQVVDPSRKSRGRRTTVVQRSLQSVVKESRRRSSSRVYSTVQQYMYDISSELIVTITL